MAQEKWPRRSGTAAAGPEKSTCPGVLLPFLGRGQYTGWLINTPISRVLAASEMARQIITAFSLLSFLKKNTRTSTFSCETARVTREADDHYLTPRKGLGGDETGGEGTRIRGGSD